MTDTAESPSYALWLPLSLVPDATSALPTLEAKLLSHLSSLTFPSSAPPHIHLLSLPLSTALSTLLAELPAKIATWKTLALVQDQISEHTLGMTAAGSICLTPPDEVTPIPPFALCVEEIKDAGDREDVVVSLKPSTPFDLLSDQPGAKARKESRDPKLLVGKVGGDAEGERAVERSVGVIQEGEMGLRFKRVAVIEVGEEGGWKEVATFSLE